VGTSRRNNRVSKQPLGEVFGFPIDNLTAEATRYREQRLCPFNNKVPSCTKDKAQDPLGVCSITENGKLAITCPVRFRERWIIAEDAANFLFPARTRWTSLTEVRLNDKFGKSAGNIDVVLVSYDDKGKVLDFGSCEVQAVYISGNIRSPFEWYMTDPAANSLMSWQGKPLYPRADYLSSSRKRLAPQLLFKGGILKEWGKKQIVAMTEAFLATLPKLTEVPQPEADVAWMIYDLVHDKLSNTFKLQRTRAVFTRFETALAEISTPVAGPIEPFLELLQAKLDNKLDGTPPENKILTDPDLV
jgi:hypothetical protein